MRTVTEAFPLPRPLCPQPQEVRPPRRQGPGPHPAHRPGRTPAPALRQPPRPGHHRPGPSPPGRRLGPRPDRQPAALPPAPVLPRLPPRLHALPRRPRLPRHPHPARRGPHPHPGRPAHPLPHRPRPQGLRRIRPHHPILRTQDHRPGQTHQEPAPGPGRLSLGLRRPHRIPRSTRPLRPPPRSRRPPRRSPTQPLQPPTRLPAPLPHPPHPLRRADRLPQPGLTDQPHRMSVSAPLQPGRRPCRAHSNQSPDVREGARSGWGQVRILPGAHDTGPVRRACSLEPALLRDHIGATRGP